MLLLRQRQARGRDLFSGGFLGGAGLVEVEEEGEDVGVLGHGVGGADGGVEFGVGVAQGIGSGFVEGAVEVAQGPVQHGHDLAVEMALGFLIFLVSGEAVFLEQPLKDGLLIVNRGTTNLT